MAKSRNGNNSWSSKNQRSDSYSTSLTRTAGEPVSQSFNTKSVRRWLPVFVITYFMLVGATVAAVALLLFDFFGPDRDQSGIAQKDPAQQTIVSDAGTNTNGSNRDALAVVDATGNADDDSSTNDAAEPADVRSEGDSAITAITNGDGSDSVSGATETPEAPPLTTANTPVAQTGTIELVNQLEPDGDDGEFDLMVNGRVVLSDTTGAGRSGPVQVDAGTNQSPGRIHIVGEAAGRGTDIGYYDSGIACVDDSGDPVSSCTNCTSVEVNVMPAANVTCTVTNYLARSPEPEATEPTAVATTDVPTGADESSQTIGTLAPGRDIAPPEISVANLARPGTILEPGGAVTYTVKVRNHSESNAELTELESSTAGSLDGKGNCLLPQTIPANGGVYSCSYVVDISGNPEDIVTNIISVTGRNEIGSDQSTNDSTVVITDSVSSIDVAKSSNVTTVAEPGGEVQFTVSISNTSPVDTVVIQSIEDSVQGNIDGKGNCRVPTSIIAGESFDCTFDAFVAGNAGAEQIGELSVVAEDDDGNAVNGTGETRITISDLKSEIELVKTPERASMPEPGGPITYFVEVNNKSSVDEVTLETLVDSIYGDLNGRGDCELPQAIAPNSTYQCQYTVDFSGNAGEVRQSQLTATGVDDDALALRSVGEATVALDDVDSSIEMTLTASAQSIAEPGGEVAFDIEVRNTSAVDSVELTKLEDTVLGDLSGAGDCEIPQTIAPSASYTCRVGGPISGAPGDVTEFVTSAAVVDDDGSSLAAESRNLVEITDVASVVEFAVSSASETLPEPGGRMKYTVLVDNKSEFDQVTIQSLQDSLLEDLTAVAGTDCELPQTVDVGASYSCSFETDISGNAGDAPGRSVSLVGVDDDGVAINDQNDISIAIDDVVSSVELSVTPSVDKIDEPGGDVSFAVEVRNTSAVDSITINDLLDSTFGKLDGLGDCDLPQTLAAGESYNCSIGGSVRGEPGQDRTNSVQVTVTDDDGETISKAAEARITFSDVASSITVSKQSNVSEVPEPGGNVEYTIAVTNSSSVDVLSIESMVDSVYGDVTKIDGSTCKLPQAVPVGDVYTCRVNGRVSGNAGNKFPSAVTVSARDDDGIELSSKGSSSVAIGDIPGSIEAQATSDKASVSEPGGTVKFDYRVVNTSEVDAVTISELTDTLLGDLTEPEDSDCSVPQTIQPGADYRCSMMASVSGNAREVRPNTFTAAATDDDGKSLSSFSTVEIRLDDVLSEIEVVTKSASKEVKEPSEAVTYEYTVTNKSSVDGITITTLSDSLFENLDGVGECELPQTLAPGDSYVCNIEKDIAGVPGEQFTNVVTVGGLDDDGTSVTSESSETVTMIDVPSAIRVEKTADKPSVEEPGGNVTFGFLVRNESAADEVTINNINDSVYGDVTAVAGTSCELPQSIAPGGNYSCEITAMVRGAAGYIENSVATATGTDDDGNRVAHSDGAAVAIEDVDSGIELRVIADKPEVTEPGDVVLYTFEMSNVSPVDPITVTAIEDTVYGDLTAVPGTTCLMPLTIAPGGRYGCAIQGQVSGEVGAVLSNEVSVFGRDNDGKELTAVSLGRVEIVGAAAGIRINQKVDKEEIAAPGDDVTFTFNLVNRSPKAVASVSSLSDSIFGDLNGLGDCTFPQSIEPNGSFSCSVAIEITGRSGETRTNTVKAVGTDDSGNEIIATDVEKITIR